MLFECYHKHIILQYYIYGYYPLRLPTSEAKLSKFDGEKALKKHLAIELSKPSDERTLKVSTLLRQHDGIEEIVKLSWEQTKKTQAEEKEGNLRYIII